MSDTDAPLTDVPRDELDGDDRLRPGFVRRVLDAVEAGDDERARALVEPLHPADIADLFELTPNEDRPRLARALADLVDADVFAEMNDYVREDLIDLLSATQVADIAAELDTDDAVAIIEDLDADDQREVLRAMEPDDRAAIEEALSYPEESAGRLMQRELIAVPEHWRVGDAIDYLRGHDELTTDFWEIFVVDAAHRPVGTCALSWVLRTPRSIAIADVMKREQTLIPVEMDQEEVALRFQKYALISAAVVDGGGRLVGMITVDDVVHIIQEEAGEDALLLSGAGEGDINEPLAMTVRTRVTWLVVNLGATILSASVVGLFQGEIARFALLAALMPIVSALGGNAGTQTLAVVVRALATNQLTSSNTLWMLVREFRIALCNGVALGLAGALGCYVILGNAQLAVVFALAMMINSMVAGLVGVLVPIALDSAKIDPAVSSAVFVTTVTDVMGFLSFLGLATLWGWVADPSGQGAAPPHPLHLTKVAFATRSVEHLAERLAARAEAGPLFLTTRYLPKRHVEVAGPVGEGSLFWILKHQLVARSPILSFGEAEGGRVAIHLDPGLVLVSARPKRAHQGWRYLEADDAPPDLGGDAGGLGALPPQLIGRLAELALI